MAPPTNPMGVGRFAFLPPGPVGGGGSGTGGGTSALTSTSSASSASSPSSSSTSVLMGGGGGGESLLAACAHALATGAVAAVSALVLAYAAQRLKEHLRAGEEALLGGHGGGGGGGGGDTKGPGTGGNVSGRRRGWFVAVGCYTQPRCADPFVGDCTAGGGAGVPHDASRTGKGITALWLDAATGALEAVPCRVALEPFGSGGPGGGVGFPVVNPSWLTRHPFLPVVYACCEVDDYFRDHATEAPSTVGAGRGGALWAFAIEEEQVREKENVLLWTGVFVGCNRSLSAPVAIPHPPLCPS